MKKHEIEDLKRLAAIIDSRRELAQKLGVSQASVSRYLSGKQHIGGSTRMLIGILLKQQLRGKKHE